MVAWLNAARRALHREAPRHQGAASELSAENESLKGRISQLETDVDGYKRSFEAARAELNFLRVHTMPITRYDHLIDASTNSKPSIFVVTLPKSGTVFVSQSLARTLGYDHSSTVCTRTFPRITIWPEVVADFARGGMVSVSHMPASSFNLQILRSYTRKCVLHVRDPRQSLVSMAHFMRGVWQKTTAKSLRPDRLAIELAEHRYYTRGIDGAADVVDHIDGMIDGYYADCVDWLVQWKTAIESREMDILLLEHQLLADRAPEYFRRIFDFYGIPEPPELKLMSREEDNHFRQGGNAEWRMLLTPEQIQQVSARLPDSLLAFYGWQR